MFGMDALYVVVAAVLVLGIGSAARTLLMMLVEWRPKLSSVATDELEETKFDFVVVGAGSAGAVLAARLVDDPSVHVLLLEAGEEDTHRRGGGFFKLPIAALGFKATPYHWDYETEDEPELMMEGAHWASSEGCSGRPLIQTRGKVLGGSSSINLCNYISASHLPTTCPSPCANCARNYIDTMQLFNLRIAWTWTCPLCHVH